MTRLFDLIRIGRLPLPNRIIMAPLTRGRTGGAGIPDALVADYYAQRASAGLLIAEATAVNREGDGWPDAPGLYTDAQESGWRAVADAVHAAGGRIFVQLWHMGRTVMAQDLDGARPLAPSEIAATGVPVITGGIIPPEDAEALKAAGVAAVYTPRTTT